MLMTKEQLQEMINQLDDGETIAILFWQKHEFEDEIENLNWEKTLGSRIVRDCLGEAETIVSEGILTAGDDYAQVSIV